MRVASVMLRISVGLQTSNLMNVLCVLDVTCKIANIVVPMYCMGARSLHRLASHVHASFYNTDSLDQCHN